jgi:Uma2 family endonuclease
VASVISEHPPVLPSDDSLYEIVDGQIVEKEMSSFAIMVALELYSSWLRFTVHEGRAWGRPLHEMVFLLDEGRNLRRRPDVSFVSAEVLSPNDLYQNVARELREYFHYGVKEVWLISPEDRLVEVYTAPESVRKLTAADSLETSLIPGWSISIGELIPVPAPA